MASLSQKMDFICEAAVSLHQYGVPANRLEVVIQGLANRLKIEEIQAFSIPTSVQIYMRSEDETAHRIVRVNPSGLDIDKLQDADFIIDSLARGQLSLLEGKKQLTNLKTRRHRFTPLQQVLAYALASLSFAAILVGTLSSVLAAAIIGLISGVVFHWLSQSSRFTSVNEMGVAFITTSITYIATYFYPQISTTSVILACIIVLLPGLTLTTALMDLATDHLVAGTARLMGAFMTLLKIFFGFFISRQIAIFFFEPYNTTNHIFLPAWAIPFAILGSSISFLVLFKMKPREFPWVLLVACVAFVIHRSMTQFGYSTAATMLAAIGIAITANAYARIMNRPATTLMLPGLILLVPGSIGYHSILNLGERNVLMGLDYAFQTLFIGILIVAGLLIGNLLLSPRRDL